MGKGTEEMYLGVRRRHSTSKNIVEFFVGLVIGVENRNVVETSSTIKGWVIECEGGEAGSTGGYFNKSGGIQVEGRGGRGSGV